jgi:hypothetical protein
VMKDNWLRVLGTPILVEDFHSVLSSDATHVFAPFDATPAGNFTRHRKTNLCRSSDVVDRG